MREEAQQLLAEYQHKRKDAEEEASDIVASAEREAQSIVREVLRSSELTVDSGGCDGNLSDVGPA